ncbi:MAG TPA: hypothetical protein VLA49_08840 [Anaerolineales bacterium]|nr:hypothetical protein [Anaerolineales bacterium]
MITTQKLAEGFALNLCLIKLQSEGVSHAESLLQAPYNINCLNWVVGHIAVNRDNVLELLGQERLLSAAETDRYRSESQPIRPGDQDVLQLERLLEILERGLELIAASLVALSREELTREIQVGQIKMNVGERLFGFYFHDTYHTGQTDLLRQVAGKNDKVI